MIIIHSSEANGQDGRFRQTGSAETKLRADCHSQRRRRLAAVTLSTSTTLITLIFSPSEYSRRDPTPPRKAARTVGPQPPNTYWASDSLSLLGRRRSHIYQLPADSPPRVRSSPTEICDDSRSSARPGVTDLPRRRPRGGAIGPLRGGRTVRRIVNPPRHVSPMGGPGSGVRSLAESSYTSLCPFLREHPGASRNARCVAEGPLRPGGRVVHGPLRRRRQPSTRLTTTQGNGRASTIGLPSSQYRVRPSGGRPSLTKKMVSHQVAGDACSAFTMIVWIFLGH